jgi:CheY-like chemotaxis protein
MDVNMPVIDGIEATKRLRTIHEQGAINLAGTKIYMHSAI